MPAQAGIQKVFGKMDSRFRGSDILTQCLDIALVVTYCH